MFNTQSSSKARLKNDTLGDSAIVKLNYAFESMELDQFKLFAKELVMSGGGKQPMKQAICDAIDSTSKKQVVYKKACDFILAGMGLGV